MVYSSLIKVFMMPIWHLEGIIELKSHLKHLCATLFRMLDFTRVLFAKTKRVKHFICYVFPDIKQSGI